MALTDITPGPAEDEISRLLRTSSLVPLTIAAWDSGALLHASAAAAALIGVPADALRGRSMLEFYVDPEQRRALQRAIEAGAGEAFAEIQLRRADGRHLWVKVAARRMTYGGVPCVLAIGQDITEHKERARALAEAHEQLRRQASNLNLSFDVEHEDHGIEFIGAEVVHPAHTPLPQQSNKRL